MRLKLGCHSPPEVQLFSSGVLSPALKAGTCGWCGLSGGQAANDEGEATLPLPVCAECLVQHKKARSSSRQNPKFDKGGWRASVKEAATARAAEVTEAKAAAAVAAPAAAAADQARVTAKAAATTAPARAEDTADPKAPEEAATNAMNLDAMPDGAEAVADALLEPLDEAVVMATSDDESGVGAPTKSGSPRRDARKATRPHDEERDSTDRPARRLPPWLPLPRAAATNNTAVAAVIAGGMGL